MKIFLLIILVCLMSFSLCAAEDHYKKAKSMYDKAKGSYLVADYDEATFSSILSNKARIVKQRRVTDHGRVLFRYQR